MSLLGWCKTSAISGIQILLKPLAVPSRFASSIKVVENQPTFPSQPCGEEKRIFRWGYYDRYRRRGLLAHNDKLDRVNTLKKYTPREPWIEKKALFGQNDYIDILGSGEVHPVNVLYNVPAWLRGFQGNELKVLIRRRKFLSKTPYCYNKPKKWHELNKRISYLYKFLNRKTKTPNIHRKT